MTFVRVSLTVMSQIKRERMAGRQKAFTRSVSLTDNDLDIARALGKGNASMGIKMALRLTTRLHQSAFELID